MFFSVYFVHRKSLEHVIESNRTAGLVEAVNRHVVETHAHTNGADSAALIKPDIEGNVAFKHLFMSVFKTTTTQKFPSPLNKFNHLPS